MKHKISLLLLTSILTCTPMPSNVYSETMMSYTGSAPVLKSTETAYDGVTNKDIYDRYLQNGIDICTEDYKEMQSMFQLRSREETKGFIEKIGLIPANTEFYNEDETINWSMKLNRGQYAEIIKNFINFYKIDKKPCCMGDSPDFSESKEGSNHYEAIVFAAQNGFYCTRNGSDGEKPFVNRELIKYLYKLTADMPKIDSFYNSIYDDSEAYENLFELNYCIEDESDTVKQTLTKLFQWNIMPRDKFYRVNLDKQLTLYELTNILLGTGDLYRLYRSSEAVKSRCMYCTLSNIDQFYPEINEAEIVQGDGK